MSAPPIGIDLGTTNSALAILDASGPRLIGNRQSNRLTPSVVGVADDGQLLVGDAALPRRITHPGLTVADFKRDMGTDRSYTLGQLDLRAEDLSALVLRTLVHDAREQLGVHIDEVVVTVPAYFGELQRKATQDACEIAGLRSARLINEPTAAALAFGLNALDTEQSVVVLDLGGGTFDVTVLELIEGAAEMRASAGDVRLGGNDFDEVLLRWALENVTPTDEVHAALLRAQCQRAKCRLSDSVEASFTHSSSAGDAGRQIAFQRTEADRRWKHLLDRMLVVMTRALRDASLNAEQIDRVLLVGGATRMPCVRALAEQFFRREPDCTLPPDEAVALGAAVQAGLLRDHVAVKELLVTDIAPFTLGVAACERVGNTYVRGLYAPILDRGTVLPASRSRHFSTLHDWQTEIEVDVFQGEHSLCRDNTHLGRFAVAEIPRDRAGMQSVEMRFTYDLNGLLDIDATVVTTGKTTTHLIERAPGSLSKSQIQRARDRMNQIKFHPRESLPNTSVLAKAEALFLQLKGMERESLAEAMAAFRLALETQDTEVISSMRSALADTVSRLET